MADLTLLAPVDGVVVPLEHLPDPVFAEKMLGDGVSIDPTGHVVVAPCAGVIQQLHRARHALTLTTDAGISVLIHVGLDSVGLKGKGFRALVREGDRVQVRQPLLEFDLDEIARGAASALTEVIVTEGATDVSFKRSVGSVTAGRDELLRVRGSAASPTPPERRGGGGGGAPPPGFATDGGVGGGRRAVVGRARAVPLTGAAQPERDACAPRGASGDGSQAFSRRGDRDCG